MGHPLPVWSVRLIALAAAVDVVAYLFDSSGLSLGVVSFTISGSGSTTLSAELEGNADSTWKAKTDYFVLSVSAPVKINSGLNFKGVHTSGYADGIELSAGVYTVGEGGILPLNSVSSPTISEVNVGTQTVSIADNVPTAGPTAGRKGIRITHMTGAGLLYVITRNVGSSEAPSSTNYIAALDIGEGWEDLEIGDAVELACIASTGSMGVRYEETFP